MKMIENSPKLYIMSVLNAPLEHTVEIMEVLGSILIEGHWVGATFIFTSSLSISDVKTHINKKVKRKIAYFLFDATTSLSSETFYSLVLSDVYNFSDELNNLLKRFYIQIPKKVIASKEDIIKRQDELLDKISREGMSSLKQDDKDFLESLKDHDQL